MKPIKLVMSAFGPYLDRTEIDFTSFGQSGLYLVTGDTGAGKSTIFEAICYALYGETVSGGERDAKMLRNKKADDNCETSVELEFIANGKTYYIKRSPKYELEELKRTRKKSEGDNTPAKHREHTNSFLLRCTDENIDYTREKDAEEKIKDIIGIGKENFKKISMIAQGEFMRVIREKTEGREKILNSVFGTQKYGKLTEKLKEYRSAAKEELDSCLKDLTFALSLITCDEKSPLYDEIESKKSIGYISVPELERIAEIIGKLVSEDSEKFNENEEKSDKNRKNAEQAAESLAKAEMKQKQKKELEEKIIHCSKMQDALPELEKNLEIAAKNNEGTDQLKAKAELIRSKLPEYDRIEKLEAESVRLEKEAQMSAAEFERSKNIIRRNAEKADSLTKQLAEYEGTEEKKNKAELEFNNIVIRGKNLRDLQKKYQSLDNAVSACEKKKKEYQSAKLEYENAQSNYNRLNTAFLDDQAGILALTLEDNKPCPVCGSLSHPVPAVMHGAAPDKAQVNKAKLLSEKAAAGMRDASAAAAAENRAEQAVREEIAAKTEELFERTIAPENAEQLRAFAEEKMKEAEDSARMLKTQIVKLGTDISVKKKMTEDIEAFRKQSADLSDQLTKLAADAASKTEQAKAAKESAAQGRSKLEFSSEKEALRYIQKLSKQASDAEKAFEAARSSLEQRKKLIGELISAQEVLKKHIAENDAPELSAIIEQKQMLDRELYELNETGRKINIRIQNNKKALARINEKKDVFEQAQKRFSACDDLYGTASGNLAGRERLKLDSYILGEYFDRIIIRANNRLKMMTDERYRLVRSETSADKRKTSGLELDIIDNESGKSRAVSTLSGGESFMAALAMSLGLSDEIQSAAGGIRLETMFIDEGFGSLDEGSLERAVDALTALGSGDCLIGIISHVARLKELIGKRIVIKRGESGNTVANVEI